MNHLLTAVVVLFTLAIPQFAVAAEVLESVDIEPVWSAHPVGFSLLTHGEDQFAAYYDAERRMSVAHRKLGQRKWTIQKLPRVTGWDTHNKVTMAIDTAGHLHVTGDMHCVPLVYFRTTRPLDVTSLEPIHRMTGQRENRVTYPVFLRDAKGTLIFRYRDGRSGSGDDVYNRYDPADQRWHRLVDQPVVSGEGKANAYCSTPQLGPDGLFHMVWVWRDTPDAATNHDPSYARSRDLVNWETSAGLPLRLPITQATSDGVDRVPAPNRLMLSYRYPKGSGAWVLDEQTLSIIPGEKAPSRPGLPREVTRIESPFPGMAKRIAYDHAPDTRAREPAADAAYALVWETLPQNRDKPRQPPLPEPVMLRVVKVPR